MAKLTMVACVILFAASASGAMISLDNWDIETNTSDIFGSIDFWAPNGGWADHASFAKPGNGSLGDYFGFYSAGADESVGQITGETILANTTYDFWSWATGGGNDTGTVLYQVGYVDDSGVDPAFVLLASNDVVLAGTWVETAGVSYTTGTAGDEIGKTLWVRLGDGAPGESDIWFDNFQASSEVIPEPQTLMLLFSGLGMMLLRRRK